ncbi:hypothetical protein M3I54_17140 [Paraburkholderia sp. CNPSo 3274]|uniref:hypothetical protein n=1 Tax=Paraburkholderia sp. CNPSo 3274 TaxID=2940932 RepID=UPI0020B84AA9|nr:hypothetical protein [Paraburkholderia sp. CNPSo 3274]MCP3708698.1 hypothetical protein [Paraburkholderia sp. CNPSo 3274]
MSQTNAMRAGKETKMYGKPVSLRAMAEKWLALQPEMQLCITRHAHGARRRRSCVYVSTVCAVGEVGMFFFRHDDGGWYIFPPHESRVSMGVLPIAVFA